MIIQEGKLSQERFEKKSDRLIERDLAILMSPASLE